MNHKLSLLSILFLSLCISCGHDLDEIQLSKQDSPITKSGHFQVVNIKEGSVSYEFSDDKSFWGQFNSLEERFDAFQVEENTLKDVDPRSLIQGVINYPLNYLVWAYNEPIDAVNLIFERSSIHKESLQRQDISKDLIEIYCNSSADENLSTTNSLFLDYIIASAIIPGTFSDASIPNLKITVDNKMQRLLNQQDTCSFVFLRPLLIIDKICEGTITSQDDIYDIVSDVDRELSISSTGESLTTIMTPCGHSLTGYVFLEMSQRDINSLNQTVQTLYPNATLLSSASSKYNCHSYAWHQNNTYNSVWLTAYYNGNHQLANYWTNDVYLSCSESEAEIIYYPDGDHSALASSNGKYISKWGAWPLMKHDPTDCPYVSTGRQYYRARTTNDPAIQWSLAPITISGDVFVTQDLDHLYTITINQMPKMTKVWSISAFEPISSQPYFSPSGIDCLVNFNQVGEYALSVDAYFNGVRYGTGVKTIYVYE